MSDHGAATLTTRALALAGATALIASGVAAQDELASPSATLVKNTDIPVIGQLLPAGDAWRIVDGPGDVMRANGVLVPNADPRSDADEVWVTVVKMNKKMRKGVDKTYGARAVNAWRGANAKTKNGQRILATVVRPVEPLDCETAVNAQLWTRYDGPNPVPYSPNRYADILAGGSTLTISGAFAASSGLNLSTGTSDLRGLEPGQQPPFFQAPAHDIGGCDPDAGVLVNFSRIPGKAKTARLAIGGSVDDSFVFDHVGVPDDFAPIALERPRSLPPFSCAQWRVVRDDASPEDRRLEFLAFVQEPDPDSATFAFMAAAADSADDERPRPSYDETVRVITRTLDLADRRVPGLRGEFGKIGYLLMGWGIIRQGQLNGEIVHDLAFGLLEGESSDSGTGAIPRHLGTIIEDGDQGTIVGDARCATFQLDQHLCDLVDGDAFVAGLGIEADEVVEDGFNGFDGQHVCNFHLNGASEPAVIIDFEEDVYAAGTALDGPLPADCIVVTRASDGRSVVLDCGGGTETRVLHAGVVPAAALSDAEEGGAEALSGFVVRNDVLAEQETAPRAPIAYEDVPGGFLRAIYDAVELHTGG